MTRKTMFFICTLCAIVMVWAACQHHLPVPIGNEPDPTPVPPPPTPTGRPCSPDSVYFVNEIQPMLISSCAMSGCHDAVSHKEGINLTTYAGVLKIVKPGNANGSSLVKEIVRTDKDRMPPPPMPAMTADQIAKIKLWINQGALNNSCDKCDTTDFKYSTAVKTLIQTKCQGCHNPASLGGGIDLSTYNGVKAVAVNGKLYGSITYTTGFSGMPKGSRMPDCEVKQIKKWIDAGSPNN